MPVIKRVHALRRRVFVSGSECLQLLPKVGAARTISVNHPLHFLLTLLTLGMWGLVWWHLILRQQGDASGWLSGFDDEYWRYLLEREQPPASLYRQNFDGQPRGDFSA